MVVTYANLNDLEQWLVLAREVEPLFGPMVEDDGFRSALTDAISNQTALCISSAEGSALAGGIVISKDLNRMFPFKSCGRQQITRWKILFFPAGGQLLLSVYLDC